MGLKSRLGKKSIEEKKKSVKDNVFILSIKSISTIMIFLFLFFFALQELLEKDQLLDLMEQGI